MAQDLLKISPEALQLQLPSISLGTLKSLYTQLYQYMRNNGKHISDTDLLLIQRKLTKIQKEMKIRLGKLNPDFAAWENKLMRKLTRG
jgi:hypothetical protein